MQRRLGYIISLVVVGLVSYFIYQKFFSVSSFGENVFSKIETHRLYYTQTTTGLLLMDMDNITTPIVTEHILISSGGNPTWDNIRDFTPRMFEIPSSIRGYELLSSWSHVDSFFTSIDVSESAYNDIWKDVYKSYQDFIDQIENSYSKESSFRYDTLKNQMIYRMKPITETRLEYRVITPQQDYFVELIFVDANGSKKLGAMLSKTR